MDRFQPLITAVAAPPILGERVTAKAVLAAGLIFSGLALATWGEQTAGPSWVRRFGLSRRSLALVYRWSSVPERNHAFATCVVARAGNRGGPFMILQSVNADMLVNALDAVSDAVVVCDGAGAVVHANRGARELFGRGVPSSRADVMRHPLAAVARKLGISRTTLWRRLKQYGLTRPDHLRSVSEE